MSYNWVYYGDCFSGKRAEEIPEDVWQLAIETQVTEINLSKNQLKTWPNQ